MKALIAMSGGVDSSVAAMLMSDCERIGCTMRLYDGDPDAAFERTCCTLDDTEDARAVCRRLGIPYYVFNYKADFEEKIIRRFVDCYRRGMTPNPCIDCNRYLKFGALMQRAEELGCDCVVTGHYARIAERDGRLVLMRAKDLSKDQSYVLYSLTQQQLQHIRFPLGELTKDRVRAIAEQYGFVNADKPDSQDICFVPDGDYAGFIERYAGSPEQGDFLDTSGRVIGRHRGIIRYTLGQRKHLGLSMGKPVFVTAIDPERNTVTVGDERDLLRNTVTVRDFNWISGDSPSCPIRCTAKTRYRQQAAPATAQVIGDGLVQITFDQPVRAATPGQAAVLYDGEIVLGGGEIV